MIMLDELVSQVRLLEGSQTYLVDPITKKFVYATLNDVIHATNTALSDISVRFLVSNAHCHLRTKQGKYVYALDAANAITVDPDNGFIIDSSAEPFKDHVLEITGVSDMHGNAMAFNTSSHSKPMYDAQGRTHYTPFSSPTWGELRVPPHIGVQDILVHYKPAIDKLATFSEEELADESFSLANLQGIAIDLPYQFLMAITYFIAMRLQSPRGTQRQAQQVYNESSGYYQKYVSECELILGNLNNNQETPDNYDNFSALGFV